MSELTYSPEDEIDLVNLETKTRHQAHAVANLYMAAAMGFKIGVIDEDEEGGVYIFSHSVPFIPLSEHERYFVTDEIRGAS